MNISENGFRAPLPEELAPLFPSYQILSLIAKGGMGAVYHAIQTSLEREIAIKILPVEFGDDPEFCKGFEAEAKAMAKLNHPNLISVYDFGEVAGMLFIAMEYVPGQSLYDACNGSAVDPVEVIRLMTGISQGLAHAHRHGILHRDIKPANILLDAVVSKATHPNPILRYQNATEIADALQKIASTMGPRAVHTASPVASKAPVARLYSRKPTKKKGNELLVTPVLIPLVIAGIVAVFFFRDQIFPKADSSPRPAPIIVTPRSQ